MAKNIYLCDIENAYCSIHELFMPKLVGKPHVTLSSNDGAVVSRSRAARAIGIKMSQAKFEVEERFKEHNVTFISGYIPLYVDFSNRFMNILRDFSPGVIPYSIDEAFIYMDGFDRLDHTAYAHEIIESIQRSLGLPTRVGIGPNQTLAKLANECAKKNPEFNRVCNINTMSPGQLDALMSSLDVRQTWGIGRKLTEQLNASGIHTVLDLKNANPKVIRARYNLLVEKTVRELNGEECIEPEEIVPSQQILRSRSFGEKTENIEVLSESISHHVSNAAEKLRAQGSYAGMIQVFISTSRFIEPHKQYSKSIAIPINVQTNSTSTLANLALLGLKRIYRPGFSYAKSGVMLGALVDAANVQTDLFSNNVSSGRSEAVMNTMDRINKKMGRGTLRIGTAGYDQSWQPKSANRCPAFTTRWDELLSVD